MTNGSRTHTLAPDRAAIGFSIEVTAQDEAVQIIPAGELDLATTEQLQSELKRVIDAGFARIVIDLRRLEFLDSTGLHALIEAQDRAKGGDWQLAIIPGARAVQRIFEITGTVDRLPFIAVNGSTPIVATNAVASRSSTLERA